MKSIGSRQHALAAVTALMFFPQALPACEPTDAATPAKTGNAEKATGKEFNKADSFLIGIAKSDFVTEQRNAGNAEAALIDKVALHGVSWFPQQGADGDVYFMGHVSLDTPITAAQYKVISAVREKHGSEQVFFKFSARVTKEGTTEFQGKLLGYYVVTDAEHEGFVSKLVKDREGPGFVALP